MYGNRIEKSYDADGAGGGGATVTRFAYDAWKNSNQHLVGNENWDVWADLNGSSSLTTRYIRGDVIDQIFSRIDSGTNYWELTDRLGSVRDVINNSAVIKDTIGYNGFGGITSETDSSFRGRYAWTGREIDTEINLQYNRARYYDAGTGRWISQDPLGFDAGDTNLYRYVKNSYPQFTDNSGLVEFNVAPDITINATLSASEGKPMLIAIGSNGHPVGIGANGTGSNFVVPGILEQKEENGATYISYQPKDAMAPEWFKVTEFGYHYGANFEASATSKARRELYWKQMLRVLSLKLDYNKVPPSGATKVEKDWHLDGPNQQKIAAGYPGYYTAQSGAVMWDSPGLIFGKLAGIKSIFTKDGKTTVVTNGDLYDAYIKEIRQTGGLKLTYHWFFKTYLMEKCADNTVIERALIRWGFILRWGVYAKLKPSGYFAVYPDVEVELEQPKLAAGAGG